MNKSDKCTVNADATDKGFSAISGGLNIRNQAAISFYYNEARNELAVDFIIVPYI